MKPAAVHHDLRLDPSGWRLQAAAGLVSRSGDDLETRANLGACCAREGGVGARDLCEVDHRRDRHPQPGDAGGVGLVVGDARGVEPFGGHAVAGGAPLQLGERRELHLLGGDDHLAAVVDPDAVLGAERLEAIGALDTEPGLQRPGGVVEPGVDDPAVAPGLVGGELGFLLDDDDVEPRVGAGE